MACGLIVLPTLLRPLEEAGVPGEWDRLPPLQLVDVGVERIDQVVLGDREYGAGSGATEYSQGCTRDGEDG